MQSNRRIIICFAQYTAHISFILQFIVYNVTKITDFFDRLTGGGGPRSARTEENIYLVNDLVLSQEDTAQTHRTVREILVIS